jgi:hypothetical protein
MSPSKERATGTAVGAMCGFLTGSFILSIGLLEFLVGLDFVPGSIPAMTGYFLGGFAVVGASTAVYMMRPSGRTLAIPLHVAAIVAFGMMTTNNMGDVSVALVGGVMAAMNVVGALSLVTSTDTEVGGRTDTSDDHATDIGTGFR